MEDPRSLASLDDPLFRLERRIARRADELSRELGFNRWRALEHWRMAEREIMEQADEGELLDWNGPTANRG